MKMRDKKVIFIGGTPYSGSTFFNMIVGNDPNGFSCGEIMNIFYPSKNYHFNPRCGCGEADCDVWHKILRGNNKNIYSTIFEMFPHINFIVDSTKNPFWIEMQSKQLKKNDIQVKNILIWKTPLEFAGSFKKRGRQGWKRSWINYHKKYFSIIDDAIAIKYSSFVNDQNHDILKRLCEFLNIRYYDIKHEYWHKKHHILFGNRSALVHLYNKGSHNYQRISESLQREQKEAPKHQSLSYKEVADANLIEETKRALAEDTNIKLLLEWLENDSENGITLIRKKNVQISYSREMILLKRLKYLLWKSIHKRKK